MGEYAIKDIEESLSMKPFLCSLPPHPQGQPAKNSFIKPVANNWVASATEFVDHLKDLEGRLWVKEDAQLEGQLCLTLAHSPHHQILVNIRSENPKKSK